jgi:hypothetical protein
MYADVGVEIDAQVKFLRREDYSKNSQQVIGNGEMTTTDGNSD